MSFLVYFVSQYFEISDQSFFDSSEMILFNNDSLSN